MLASLGPPPGWAPSPQPARGLISNPDTLRDNCRLTFTASPGKLTAAPPTGDPEWRTEGSPLLGLDLVRNVLAGGADDNAASETPVPEGANDEPAATPVAEQAMMSEVETPETPTKTKDDAPVPSAEELNTPAAAASESDSEDPTQARAKVIGWLPKEESEFLDDEGKPAALYRIRYVSGDLAGDIEDLEEHEVRASVPYEDRVKLAEREQIIFEEAEARGLDAKAVTPPHYVAPRSPPRVMLPLVPDSDSDDSDDSEDDDDVEGDRDWAPPTPVPMREVDLRASTFAGSYQDLADDDVAPLPKRQKIAAPRVGDRVSLTLDPLEGVVTKTGSGWYTVKFEFGGVDNFRADELLVL